MHSNFLPTLIRASAGTGKTYRLTNRFITLLAAGEKVERVLATTFTKKAAAEILERLLLRIAQASLDTKAAQELGAAIAMPTFSQQDAVVVLQRIVQAQHRLQISTLDSFFSRIAKSFPLELSLPLAWEIADPESEADLRAEALDIVFHANKAEQHRLAFLSLLQATQQSAVGTKLYRILDGLAVEMYAAFRSSEASAWQQLFDSGNVPSAESVISALKKLELPLTKQNKPHATWVKEIEKICNALLEKSPDFDALLGGGISAKIASGESSYSGMDIPGAVFAAYEKFFALARSSLRAELQQRTKALHDFLQQFHQAFTTIKAQKGVLLFDDIKHALLQGGKFEQMEEIYFRLDASLRHILLDEFQDTSIAEWRILHPFVEEVLASADGEHSFFCVGDVKQAIYGWRGGESLIFDILNSQFPQLDVVAMDTSYRSAPVVMDAVNQVFANIAKSQSLASFPEVVSYWSKRFTAHATAHTQLQGFVSLDVVSDGSGVVSQRRELADARAVELVQQVRRENPTASIAILYRRNKPIARMIYLLKRLNIAASEEGGNPLTDSRAVTIMLSLLRLAEHPNDGVAEFCLFKSPIADFCGLRELHNTAAVQALGQRVRTMVAYQGLGETLSIFAEALWSALDARESERLRQFLEEAKGFAFRQGGRLQEFVQFIERKRVDSSTYGVVRVMNIHQSKGLEFDVVILPELDGKLDGRTPKLLSARESQTGPVTFVSAYPKKGLLGIDHQLNALATKHTEARISESLALLYVAMTRARYSLQMIVTDSSAAEKEKLQPDAILLELLCEGSSAKSEVYPQRVFVAGNAQWKHVGAAQQHAAKSSMQGVVPSLQSETERQKHFFTKAPSEIDQANELKDVFKKTVSSHALVAKERGKFFHALFERISWLEETDCSPAAIKRDLASLFVQLPLAGQYLDEFLQMLTQPELQRVLSKPDGQAKVFRELPFAFRDNETMYRGVIDRLIISGCGTKAELIDFKTDNVEAGQEALFESKAKQYQSQLAIYQVAAAKFLKLQPAAVQTSLLFVASDRLISSPIIK